MLKFLPLMLFQFIAPQVQALPLETFLLKDQRTAAELRLELQTSEKPRVILFFSTRCPCSASHEETITRLATEFPEFSFLGVHSNQDEGPQDIKKFLARTRLEIPLYSDPDARLADALGALKTPHAFVLSKSGEILYNGGVSDSHDASLAKKFYLKDTLEDLKAQRKIRRAQTRSLGCMISRRSTP